MVNAPPLVSAGDPQTVTEGTTVSVTAPASDPNGDSMTYAWSQVSGPMVSLSSTNSLTTSFEAPNVNDSVDIVLRLAVTDSREPRHRLHRLVPRRRRAAVAPRVVALPRGLDAVTFLPS